MDGKLGTFFLGIIAAVVLYMLWNKEQHHHTVSFFPTPGSQPSASPAETGCASCGASPSVQAGMSAAGVDGMIAPPGVPLNAVSGGQGATSFYTDEGVTPDTSFFFASVPRVTNPSAIGTPAQPGALQNNVPGSPSTPSFVTPVRATQQVPPFSVGGFHQHYNVLGVPLAVLSSKGYLQ